MAATMTKVRTRAKSAVNAISQQNLTGMTQAVRKVALASVGAVAVAGDQMRTQVKSQMKNLKVLSGGLDKLAERGEVAEKTTRKAVREFLTQRGENVKKGAGNITGKVEHQVASILGKLNVPTKSDIVELTRRIDALSRKIDRM